MKTIADLIHRISSGDEDVSTSAWQHAGPYGAPAVKPLVSLMASGDETGRRARRALEKIVHHAGHPGLKGEARAVERAILDVLPGSAAPVRRTLLWMLSEIGTDRSISALAGELANPEVREDARCALTRLPGNGAVRALRKAFQTAPEDFKYALAESLRQRGQTVEGYPSQKLQPTARTEVQPVKRKQS